MGDQRDQYADRNVDDIPAKAKESKEKLDAEKNEEVAAAKGARGKDEPEPVDEGTGRPKVAPKRRRKKADDKPEDKKQEAEAKDEGADEPSGDEPSADEVAEKAKPADADKPKRRRRGAAEVSAKEKPAPAARREPDGKVIVRAKARYVRTAPR